jgi:hypothetical protein
MSTLTSDAYGWPQPPATSICGQCGHVACLAPDAPARYTCATCQFVMPYDPGPVMGYAWNRDPAAPYCLAHRPGTDETSARQDTPDLYLREVTVTDLPAVVAAGNAGIRCCVCGAPLRSAEDLAADREHEAAMNAHNAEMAAYLEANPPEDDSLAAHLKDTLARIPDGPAFVLARNFILNRIDGQDGCDCYDGAPDCPPPGRVRCEFCEGIAALEAMGDRGKEALARLQDFASEAYAMRRAVRMVEAMNKSTSPEGMAILRAAMQAYPKHGFGPVPTEDTPHGLRYHWLVPYPTPHHLDLAGYENRQVEVTETWVVNGAIPNVPECKLPLSGAIGAIGLAVEWHMNPPSSTHLSVSVPVIDPAKVRAAAATLHGHGAIDVFVERITTEREDIAPPSLTV